MDINHERLTPLRRGHAPLQEHVIDEFVAGNLSRRQFLSRATKVGLGLPLAAAILEACGSGSGSATSGGSSSATTTPAAASTGAPKGKAGATIRVGQATPSGAINPLLVNSQGGLETLDIVGEWLTFCDEQLVHRPMLATKWSPNADATVWDFTIRQGVKFNDGTPLTVDDVVYTMKQQANPKLGVNAASVFGGTLAPDGVEKLNDTTVRFHLEAADGSFTDAVSQTNYNVCIVPNHYDFANFQKEFPGTGKFMMKSYTENVGGTFVRNPHYWGTPALPAELQLTYFASEGSMTSALAAGSIDVDDLFTVSGSPQLLSGNYNVLALKSSLQRQLSMRCDTGPFTNKLVRQAMALTLNRPDIVQALFKGYAQVGNDNPFAPVFPMTDTSVPQRTQDIAKAKRLMSQAGVPRGFSVTLATEQFAEIPAYAEIVKQSAAQIGIDITLSITSQSQYYGAGVFGKSPWLDGTMSIVDYGARGVPNVYLEAPLQSIDNATGQGAWNAAHFNDPTYDKLSKQYVAAVDLSSQRKLAGQIEQLLLDETPVIWAYFFDGLTAQAKNVSGVYPTPLGIFYYNMSKS
ncbi:MAG TPA: ABC transporter substrate-binding protein [Acidimicrobiales bacterium]|nr:ABC transporter substrate-binding protein [Acidimicrobiales bacterium]